VKLLNGSGVVVDLQEQVAASCFVSKTQLIPAIFCPDDLITLAMSLVEFDLEFLDQDLDTLVVTCWVMVVQSR